MACRNTAEQLQGTATLIVISLLGSMITAVAGVDTRVEVDPNGMVYDLNAYLGDNLAVFVLGAVFGGLGIGASWVISAIGTTLLYRALGGPIDPSLLPADQPGDEPTEP